MKITAIEAFRISVPFVKPYALSKKYGTLTHAQAVIVRVLTDEGMVGLGEADPMNPFTEETPATVGVVLRDCIAPLLIGKDPRRIGQLEKELDEKVKGHLLARGAINMALYDLAGKAATLPAHALLGGKVAGVIPSMGPIGSGTPDEDVQAIEEWRQRGYKTIMIKMGALPIEREIERMVAANERFGDKLKLIVDANQGWSVGESIQFISRIGDNWPRLIEQPIAGSDLEGMKRIADLAQCPISADEGAMSFQDIKAHLESRAASVLSIKVSKNGGLSKGKAIAQAAELFGVKILMNSMLEFGITQAASAQLGCTLPNLMDIGHAYMSVVRLSEDVTDFGRNIENGNLVVPDRPGLGIELNEEVLNRFTEEKARFG